LVDAALRRQLVQLCRSKSRGYANLYPSKWWPHEVDNPETRLRFSDWSAWELIATAIEAGLEIEEIVLDIPEGKTGYVMKIPLGSRRVYVKWMLGAGKIIGRSFHYEH
jgi:hypothetical protein